MFYHFASTPTFTGTDAEMLYLWIRVIAFIGVLGGSAYFLSLYTKKKRSRVITNTKGKVVIADTCPLGNRQFLMIAQYLLTSHLDNHLLYYVSPILYSLSSAYSVC